ncbi:YeeE/YedE family protein [Methylobacterium sp. C25]|uniref:DUF6691 family protein n=1 Tax=Methylobacterium sp. C25 TaxID=2721622 RepID=UPI001F1DBC76|nr:DUF6691 family protein [Methylobacterium sp. C25]MCE4226470.1 YeeE/YedE family protein [Methylobacterium sp. C25]
MTGPLRLAVALVAGLLFGLGLAISGMMNPTRVLGFLDVAGRWDPSLAFVLGGAVGVSSIGYVIAARMRNPVMASRFDVPTTRIVDARLIGGATLFGIGWGLVGLCPGPALAALPLGLPSIGVFVVSMVSGMVLFSLTSSTTPRSGAV